MRRGARDAECGASARRRTQVWPRATGVSPALRIPRVAFTLAEIIVVLVVLGVAAGCIVPRMSGSLAKREIREAAGEFAATARTVRELAVANGRTMSIQIDLDRGAYAVATREAKGRSNELTAVQMSWLKAGKWPPSVRKASLRTTDGNTLVGGTQRVDFNPDGTTSGAAVGLMGESERDMWQVVISPRTGRVTLSDGRSEPPVEQYDLGD